MKRRLLNLWCRLTGGHRLSWPHGGHNGELIVANCLRCGHIAVVSLAGLTPPRLRYAGVPQRHKLDIPASRRFRVLPMRRRG